MDEAHRPRTVERVGERFLAIVWEDGHESVFEAPFLRKQCPCAGCRTASMREPAPQPQSGLRLVAAAPGLAGLEEVGNYALRIVWSDGHSAGLYDFKYLRSLCPCEICGAPAADARPDSR